VHPASPQAAQLGDETAAWTRRPCESHRPGMTSCRLHLVVLVFAPFSPCRPCGVRPPGSPVGGCARAYPSRWLNSPWVLVHILNLSCWLNSKVPRESSVIVTQAVVFVDPLVSGTAVLYPAVARSRRAGDGLRDNDVGFSGNL
jgi:hypothetical protein